MSAPIIKLFTQPNYAWTDIRHEEEEHPRHYLAHLVLLALIPAVCLYIGTTYLVTILVEMILLWTNVLAPEYLRATVG